MSPGGNWSETLKSDLDKLTRLAGPHPRSETVRLKEGERRTVTILFLDIQGFTAMSEKLDPEDVQLIVDNTFKILTHEIEKFHGYVEKYEGDRLMALFGSRQASELDCQRALCAALGMQEKFSQINRLLAERRIGIGMRIGVNTGLVVTGRIGKGREQDFTVMGDAVNLASRLETHAPPGQILLSEEAARAAGDFFLYEPPGKIEVKGKAEPVSVRCLRGLNPSRPERWERSALARRSGFVGREKEIEELMRAAARLEKEGRGIGAVGIRAPAGMGKSRLVHEFCAAFQARRGAAPLRFRAAVATDRTEPYALFSDLLGNVLAREDLARDIFRGDGRQGERLEPVARYLSGRGEADERMRALEPAALRLEMQLAIRFVAERLAALARESGCGPLFLHLDDLQWADAASLEALQFLGANLSPEKPVLFLWSYRNEFRPADDLRASFHLRELVLAPLSDEECGRICANLLRGPPPAAPEWRTLIRRAGGNPFFLEELIGSLADDGTLVRRGREWTLTRPIRESELPESVNRILLSRIDRLEGPLKEILAAASVAGESFALALLEGVGAGLGVGAGEVERRLRALEEVGFLSRGPVAAPAGQEISFRQSVTRDAVYSTLLNHNKKILHALVGRCLKRLSADRAEEQAACLFHHFSRGGIADEAVACGLRAVEQMLQKHAAHEGLDVIGALRPLLADGLAPPERFAAQVRLREAEIRFHDFLGRRGEQLRAVEELALLAASSGAAAEKARAAWGQSLYAHGVGDFRKARDRAAEGLGLLKNEGAARRLRLELKRLLGIAAYNLGEYTDALATYGEGLQLARESGDRGAEASFIMMTGLVHFYLGRAEEALECHSRALEIFTEIGDRRGVANSAGNRGLVFWNLGEYSRALGALEESYELFKEIGFRKNQAATLGNLGVIRHKLGQYREALGCYEQALAIRRAIGDRSGEGYDLVNAGLAHVQLGDLRRAREFLEAGLVLARATGVPYLTAEALNTLSTVLRGLAPHDPRRWEDSLRAAEEALKIGLEHNLVGARIKALSNLGRTLAARGETARAVAQSEAAMKLLAAHPGGVEGAEEEAHLNHYQLLAGLNRAPEAREVLRALVKLLGARAAAIREEEYRRSFLESVPQNRYALDEWKRIGGV